MTATKLFLDRVIAAKKVAEENEENRGPPTINIVIQGAKARTTMGRVVEADFERIEDNDEADSETDSETAIEEGEYDDGN